MAINKLRIGGLNSGIDTEAMVKAMSASTMLKLNGNRRKIKKLEAQQVAYRDVISKLQSFRSKYFDVLNKSTFLKSSAIFNQFKALTTVNGEVKTPVGVTVSPSSYAAPGTYTVELLGKATQATMTANTFASNKGLSLDKLNGGETYGFSIKVGSTSKNIVFEAKGNEVLTTAEINDKLKEAFGKTNNGDGIVKIDLNGYTGVFSSSDKKEISFTDFTRLDETETLRRLESLKGGTNTFKIQVDGEIKTFSFNSLDADFFNILFDAGGNLVTDAGKDAHINAEAEKRFAASYDGWVLQSKYKAWNASLVGTTGGVAAGEQKLYEDAFASAKLSDPSITTTYGADLNKWLKDEKIKPLDAYKIVTEDTAYSATYDLGVDPKDVAALQDSAFKLAQSKDKTLTASDKAAWLAANCATEEDAYRYLNFDSIKSLATTDYNSKKSIFDQALAQQYNDLVVRATYNDWAKDTANGVRTEPTGKPLDFPSGFPVTERDRLFDKYYDYREEEQLKTYWDRFYTANKDKAEYAGYANVNAMNDAYTADSDPTLKAAFDKFNVPLDRVSFFNIGYSEFDAFKWAFNEGASRFTSDPLEIGGSPVVIQSLEDFRAGKAVGSNAYTVDWADFAGNAAGPDIDINVGGISARLEATEYASFNNIDDLNTWLTVNGLADLVEVTDNGGGTFSFKATNPDDFFSITSSGAPVPGVTVTAPPKFTASTAAEIYNQTALKNALSSLSFAGGKIIEVNFDENGDAVLNVGFDDKWQRFYAAHKADYSYDKLDDMKAAYDTDTALADAFDSFAGKLDVSYMDAPAENKTLLGINEAPAVQSAAAALTTTLSEMVGKDAFDEKGEVKIKINGADITLRSTMTVTDMINVFSSSNAGVTMTFSSLTNTFEIVAKEYGTGGKVEIQSGAEAGGFLNKLGFGYGTEATPGANLTVNINGQEVQTASNSATVNGVTFTFSSAAKTIYEGGEAFTSVISKDTSSTVSAIKSFVEDYNKLITEVFGMITEKPNKDYHFITDYDIEEMELTDRLVEQWEKAAKVGILYNDSTVTDIMERLRSVMYSSATSIGGSKFALFNIRGYDGTVAIKTSSDYKKHGMLDFDEKALTEAMEINPDEIANLFTNTTDGLMKKLEDVLNYAVKSTGARDDMGILVRKAGLSGGISALDNSIFDQIKGLNETIDRLQTRYDKQQDRYWKQFTNMEKQFAVFNNQSSYITSMFASMSGNNNKR